MRPLYHYDRCRMDSCNTELVGLLVNTNHMACRKGMVLVDWLSIIFSIFIFNTSLNFTNAAIDPPAKTLNQFSYVVIIPELTLFYLKTEEKKIVP